MAVLIRIGNSRGVRIPRSVIEQARLEDRELELQVVPEGLLIKPKRPVREGWAKAFTEMHAAGDDEPLMDGPSNRFDDNEWTWWA